MLDLDGPYRRRVAAEGSPIESEHRMLNLAVVAGVLTRPPQLVELTSGSRVSSFEVTVRGPERPAEVVPATWIDPPTWVATLEPGNEIVLSGRVRRRFSRAGGVTQSRTEVVVSRMVRAGSKARVRTLLTDVADTISSSDVSG